MQSTKLSPALLAACLALMSPASRAATVLQDGPDTHPIANLYRADEDDRTPAPPPLPVQPSAAAIVNAIYPLQPQRLSVGTEPTRPLPSLGGRQPPRLPYPLVFLGTDAASLDWLTRNAAALRQMHAVGLIIQADNPAQVAQVRHQVPGLTILAVPGDDLAAQWGVRHYPVIVGPDSIRSTP